MAKVKKFAMGGMSPANMTLAGPGPKPLGPNSPVKPTAVQQMPGNTPPGRTAMPAGSVDTIPRPVGTPLGAPRITPPVPGRVLDLNPNRLKPTIMPTGGRMKKGGTVSSASKRADGVATKGKTKGRFV